MARAISVRGLGKRYLVGAVHRRTNSLREALVDSWRASLGRIASGASEGPGEEFWALRDVDFEVAPGEVLGIVGRNGAGKSTLLKVLSRVTEPTTGEVELWGRVASLLEVGTGFHPELTGRENVYLNGTILGMRKREIDRKFDEIVAFAEVERFVDTPVKRYSSGMYVRLAFAVAAHLEPEILVVDEVLAVGDAAFQRKCLGKMSDVAQQGRTVLFVSHNMAAVQRLCGTALLLEGGRAVARGPAREVVGRYLAGDNRPRYLAPVRTGGPQVLSAELTAGGPAGRPLNTDAIGFRLVYTLPARAPGIQIGIGVLSADGEPLFTSQAADQEVAVPGEAGEHEVVVTLPPEALLAGDFGLAVCLWNDAEILDLQEPALGFSVEPGPSVLYRSSASRKGHVHIPCAWRVAAPALAGAGAR